MKEGLFSDQVLFLLNEGQSFYSGGGGGLKECLNYLVPILGHFSYHIGL